MTPVTAAPRESVSTPLPTAERWFEAMAHVRERFAAGDWDGGLIAWGQAAVITSQCDEPIDFLEALAAVRGVLGVSFHPDAPRGA